MATTAMAAYKIRIIANACITRYNNGEAADLKTILDVNYASLAQDDRAAVIVYVAQIRPDIPYEVTEATA
ncbi:hypothetical protein [Paenibacillus agricola]|uniref:Uncharacterized protein n=1 Tax=Paenibacillus agricola TaxID=2716264 RepID=A0ABX0J569_9BACL|nr:hypothetical protein [Paenibacillus agricola]NHN31118.1 hypothetical protein [Paenibacillus agricola]